MADITTEHVKHLSIFDRALAEGPDYGKLAVQGAVLGGVLSLAFGQREDRGTLTHAANYGVAGAGFATLGIFLLFQAGKVVSERSHEAVAEAAVRGAYGHQHHHHAPHMTGWDLFHDVFGAKDPFHGGRQEAHWEHHHQLEEHPGFQHHPEFHHDQHHWG